MANEPWVSITAAVLSALVTAAITRLDDIINLFRGSTRSVAGDWEGASYLRPMGADDTWDEKTTSPDIRYIVHLTQIGRRVKGAMTMTDAPPWVCVRKLNYVGKIVGDFFAYEATSTSPEEFRFSTAMLNISTSGKEMDGFFVANGGARDAYRVFTGFTTMNRLRHGDVRKV